MPPDDAWLKTGQSLSEALNTVDLTNEYAHRIADDLLYEHTITMISAEPGCGKSVIALQIAASLAFTSQESRIFGQFFVGEPQLVYYLQLEGSLRETLRRLKVMGQTLPFDPDLIALDCSSNYNVLRDQSADLLLHRIQQINPDVLIIDPLYLLVAGGLSRDEPASAVARFLLRLLNELHCAILVLHHTTKATYAQDGRRMEKDDEFYGSQWIKAHVDTSFQLMPVNKERTEVKLICKKDRYGRVPKEILLAYNPETFCCLVPQSDGKPNTFEQKLLAFFSQRQGEAFTTNQLQDVLGCSMAMMKKLRAEPSFDQVVTFEGGNGKRTIWKVKGESRVG